MALSPGQYHLGAPASIVLDANTSAPIDLGSSMGGVTIDAKPTFFKAVPDQVIGPVAAWMTGLDVTVSMSLPELSSKSMLTALSRPTSGVTTVAAGTLGAIAAPTSVVNGTPGVVSYTYKVFAYTSAGDGIPIAIAAPIITGPATLSAVNSITINWVPIAGAVGFGIERTVGGTSQGLLARVSAPAQSFTDTGALAATAYIEAIVQPTFPNTDSIFDGNGIAVPTHRLDLVIPKNIIGATLNRRCTVWSVYSDGDFSIDFKRDKNSEYKVQLQALMDLTQPAGQEFFRLQNEY